MHKKQLLYLAMLFAILLLPVHPALSQEFARQQDGKRRFSATPAQIDGFQAQSDQGTEMLRDLRSEKKQMVAANMTLTGAEAEKFWPVYDQYAADLAKIDDTKLALIKDYLQNVDVMNGEEAETYVKKREAVDESVMQLRLKYIPAFRKVLSGRQTARFFQIDWRLGVLIDLQLAQLPLIDP